MRERPADIHDSDVAAALARQWTLTVRELFYLPVGFGGYHWAAIDQTGARWFVTVSDLAAPWVLDLSAAMQTASWLAREADLKFVVAPVPTTAGKVVGSLDTRHALTLFRTSMPRQVTSRTGSTMVIRRPSSTCSPRCTP